MSLSREFRWVPTDLYQQLQQSWPDVTIGRLSAPRAERMR